MSGHLCQNVYNTLTSTMCTRARACVCIKIASGLICVCVRVRVLVFVLMCVRACVRACIVRTCHSQDLDSLGGAPVTADQVAVVTLLHAVPPPVPAHYQRRTVLAQPHPPAVVRPAPPRPAILFKLEK
jgi:hypothetical protein